MSRPSRGAANGYQGGRGEYDDRGAMMPGWGGPANGGGGGYAGAGMHGAGFEQGAAWGGAPGSSVKSQGFAPPGAFSSRNEFDGEPAFSSFLSFS